MPQLSIRGEETLMLSLSDDGKVRFENSNATVMCFIELGLGHAVKLKFSALMNIPRMHHKTYQRLSKKVCSANIDVSDIVLRQRALATAVQEVYGDLEDSDDDGDYDTVDDQPLYIMVPLMAPGIKDVSLPTKGLEL